MNSMNSYKELRQITRKEPRIEQSATKPKELSRAHEDVISAVAKLKESRREYSKKDFKDPIKNADIQGKIQGMQEKN